MDINMIEFGYRDTYRRPIYVSVGELLQWAYTKSQDEASPYKTDYTAIQTAFGKIDALFNGTKTYVDPISGQTVYLPKLCETGDTLDRYWHDFNVRLVGWPLFPLASMYTPDNDDRFHKVVDDFIGRVNRFVNSYGPVIVRSLQALSIKYNPIADYWSKSTELGGSAPYITLTNPEEGEEPTISGWNSDTEHTDGYKSHSYADNNDLPTVKGYTTTDDDASTGRLANYQTSEGGSFNETNMPNSGYVKKFKEEGNKGQNVQDLIQKEMELASAMEGLLDNFFKELNKRTLLGLYQGA